MNLHWVRLQRALASFVVMAAFVSTGCGNRSSSSSKTYSMGERVLVGQFYVVALETKWLPQLGQGASSKTANNRFLLVRVTVTNQGGQEGAAPLFQLEDSKGQSFREFQQGDVIPQWLGLLRRVGPAMTESGNIVFDVPPGPYKLRATALGEGEDADKEPTALIDIPLILQ